MKTIRLLFFAIPKKTIRLLGIGFSSISGLSLTSMTFFQNTIHKGRRVWWKRFCSIIFFDCTRIRLFSFLKMHLQYMVSHQFKNWKFTIMIFITLHVKMPIFEVIFLHNTIYYRLQSYFSKGQKHIVLSVYLTSFGGNV